MANAIEQKLVSLYDDIKLGACGICQKCRSDNPGLYSKAVGCWFVGNVFESQEKRLLFIGKNARGMPAEKYAENQNDKGFLEEFRCSRDGLWSVGWPYWRYTSEISRRLFGEAGMEAVAFTNMVKCNGSDTVDTTTASMKDYCINGLRVVRKEIEIIRPTHIIFYTHTQYDDWIPTVFDEIYCLRSENKIIGQKLMPYDEYDCKIGNAGIKALRIGHPERMKKEDYISSVVDWVNNN